MRKTYGEGEAIGEEAEYWNRQVGLEVGKLPVDEEGGDNEVGSEARVTVSLSREQTRALLTEAPSAYRTQINDLLLTAMVMAYREWSGSGVVRFNLEGHGREALVQ